MDYPLVSGIVAASSQLIHGLYDFNIERILYIYIYIHTWKIALHAPAFLLCIQ